MLTVHGGDEEMQSWGATDGLTGRGGDMGLEARGEARDSTSCRAGGREALDRIEDSHRVSGGGRAKELDDTNEADGSRGLDGRRKISRRDGRIQIAGRDRRRRH